MSLTHSLATRALRRLGPEMAHRLTIAALKAGLGPKARQTPTPDLAVDIAGLRLPNAIGLAAGFDKNAEVPDAMLTTGFGFVECGTVTPLPQPGNPTPRLFRLTEDLGVINRLGFNNGGLEPYAARLAARARQGVVGANVGANKDAADRIGDYVTGLTRLWPLADYFTVNISSPNTPGLRDLQQASALDDLLARALDARDRMAEVAPRRPVLLKIAPDLSLADLDDAVRVARARGIDGMIVSNTTLARPESLRDEGRSQTGGLSGAPLFALATHMLAQTFIRVDGQFPLIGVGGVDSPEAAWAKIEAGASLVQLYSSLVYEGLGLIPRLKNGLVAHLRARKLGAIGEAVGSAVSDWL